MSTANKIHPSSPPSYLDEAETRQALTDIRRSTEVEEMCLGSHAHISLKYLIYPVVGVAVVVAAVGSGLSLMRTHDVMKEPEYWSVSVPVEFCRAGSISVFDYGISVDTQ